MADLSYTTVQYRGLTFGRPNQRRLRRGDGLTGWDELPPSSTNKAPRFGLHGNTPSSVRFDGRTVTMAGFVEAATNRDDLVAEFTRIMTPPVDPADTDELTITVAGRSLTADAQLLQASTVMGPLWGSGWFEYKAQWWCPDHRRFGGWNTITAPITAPVTGLVWPVTFPITFPANPPSGSATLYNEGTAPAPAIYTITGPIQQPGVSLEPAGKRVVFDLNLADGQQLVIDTATPGGLLDGQWYTANASSDLTCELEVPAGTSTVQALGQFLSGSPSFVAAFRSAYW